MPQLRPLFPIHIKRLIEPFVGGGSSFLNTKAQTYLLNDINPYIIRLHQALIAQDFQSFLSKILKKIQAYGLSCSFQDHIPPFALRQTHKKTYFAHYNKIAYERLRADFNAHKQDMETLYLLLIYGFNHMLRFNAKGDFNLPVGNVDFNRNVVGALKAYFEHTKTKQLQFFSLDFKDFLGGIAFKKGDFVYCDPPYLISGSEYNKLWGVKQEQDLYALLQDLDAGGVAWGLSNLATHKGQENPYLLEFAKSYKTFEIQSNYISFKDNSLKKNSREIYITNA
ncbi:MULTISPECIES: Dam family site-specific DNA-(adenine-N6)-methyltransferase [unclassified Helicobacter]|nr:MULTISPECIES: Dam family site-specific DNA-(adenine-N6)-methyltransferase [unclassified Helicobacter]